MKSLVAALGVAQIVSWGTLFYAIGVLGAPMAREFHVSELFVFGAFTAGLLVSGTLSPVMGRLVDRRGGRFVLSLGSVLAFTASAMLALAPNAAVMAAGWLTAGAAMAACLYDPAFATLSQHAGPGYRRAVTTLTLFGGLASTVFWPLSQFLLQEWGWRAAFAAYAALHVLVCLPIHWLAVPSGPRKPAPRSGSQPPVVSVAFGDPRLHWLSACFAIATFVFAVVAVHMVGLLTTAGLTPTQAVGVAMIVGPAQVAGRVVEMGFASRVRAVSVGYASFVLMGLALAALIAVHGMGAMAIVFVLAYGCSNGVLTIVKGTAPSELFGHVGLGRLLGHLSRASLYARAIAPAAYSAVLAAGFTRNAALGVLIVLAFAGVATFAIATRLPPARIPASG